MSTKRIYRSGRNSRKTKKPGWCVRQTTGRHTLRRDYLKPPGRGNKNPLVFLKYSVLQQKRRQTRNYGGAGIQQQWGQPRSQTKLWTLWRGNWTILLWWSHKLQQKEDRSQSWRIFWRYQWTLLRDSSNKSSVFPSSSMLRKIERRRQPASENFPEGRLYAHIVRRLAVQRHTGKMLATLTQRK